MKKLCEEKMIDTHLMSLFCGHILCFCKGTCLLVDREENMGSGWLKDVATETLGSDDAFSSILEHRQ